MYFMSLRVGGYGSAEFNDDVGHGTQSRWLGLLKSKRGLNTIRTVSRAEGQILRMCAAQLIGVACGLQMNKLQLSWPLSDTTADTCTLQNEKLPEDGP